MEVLQILRMQSFSMSSSSIQIIPCTCVAYPVAFHRDEYSVVASSETSLGLDVVNAESAHSCSSFYTTNDGGDVVKKFRLSAPALPKSVSRSRVCAWEDIPTRSIADSLVQRIGTRHGFFACQWARQFLSRFLCACDHLIDTITLLQNAVCGTGSRLAVVNFVLNVSA